MPGDLFGVVLEGLEGGDQGLVALIDGAGETEHLLLLYLSAIDRLFARHGLVVVDVDTSSRCASWPLNRDTRSESAVK